MLLLRIQCYAKKIINLIRYPTEVSEQNIFKADLGIDIRIEVKKQTEELFRGGIVSA